MHLVTVGVYDDKTYHIVRGASSSEDAEAQVKKMYEKRYVGGCPNWEPVSVEEIKIGKGVTTL